MAIAAQSQYVGTRTPAWCPGCGNFGILRAVNKALTDLSIAPWEVLMVSGIGQAGKLPHYTRANIFNSLHGRPLPPAEGAKIANRKLKVIAFSGDGDAYGEGGNHFIHAIRRNHEITYLVHDNQVYGLTKGQSSPTSDAGFISKTSPTGAAQPIAPLALAIAAGVSFAARGFAGDPDDLAELIKLGIGHKGFALIEILQPCVTFNKTNTFAWYKQRIYKLGSDYDPQNRAAALEKAFEWGPKIPTGVIYRAPRATMEDILGLDGMEAPATAKIEPRKVEPLLDTFM
jgi:2-oxoglutarate/2-oxoacid ferredoxin oxidoreductase subunit beta